VPEPLDAARTFMDALEARDAERAASVCAEDVQIELPGGDSELQGKDGARRLVRMAPNFVRRIREHETQGTTVILRGLTRAPGQFANYSTWTFETEGGLITHVTFAWRHAN
jgi:limonene-1,2-epoxide hydrolase